MSATKKTTENKLPSPVRRHRKVIAFNDSEIAVIRHFFKKYKISNESKFFREAIIATILKKAEEDHPTLF